MFRHWTFRHKIAETDVSAHSDRIQRLQKRMFRHNVPKLFLAETSGSHVVRLPVSLSSLYTRLCPGLSRSICLPPPLLHHRRQSGPWGRWRGASSVVTVDWRAPVGPVRRRQPRPRGRLGRPHTVNGRAVAVRPCCRFGGIGRLTVWVTV